MPGPGSPASVADSITRERAIVADRVMHAGRHRRAEPEAVDQIDVPQRAPVVERGRREVSHQPAQCLAVTRCRQRDPMEVIVGVEVRVVVPVRGTQRPAGATDLPKARGALDDALGVDRALTVLVRRLVEPHQRVDDHQVGRAVHPQPGGVRM
jgi:hypothetical protein